MRRPLLPTFIRWAILTGYALLVALGHGGWHVVVDHNACPAHGSHDKDVESLNQVKRTTCSHGHVHTHHAKHIHGPQPHEFPDQDTPTHHEPHDQDHCSVCAVFSTPLTLTTVVELVFLALETNPKIEWLAAFVPVPQDSLPSPRGPPVC